MVRPQIWALELHLVLPDIWFKRTDCDHSIYISWFDDMQVMLQIHMDNRLLASDSKNALQSVKTKLSFHFKQRDLEPTISMLRMQ